MNPPLTDVRVVEIEGIGPAPLTGRILADMGAAVTVIAKPGIAVVNHRLGGAADNPMRRGKAIRTLDLKQAGALEETMDLVAASDVLIEGCRPGVMERLGLGPAACAARNPRLIYGRMTGWGQSGPLAQVAGHDLNYVALTGLLSLSARNGQRPLLPPTLLGDGTGALGLALGITCALLEVRTSGRGRVVDCAIIDVLSMAGMILQWIRDSGGIDGTLPSPFHDSPFYDVYRCADDRFITIGALEPHFYALLLSKLAMTDVDPAEQYQCAAWPALKARFTALFASRSRAHWCEVLEGSDVCFAPVLSIAEAVVHPHNAARRTYSLDHDGAVQVASAPRFLPLAP